MREIVAQEPLTTKPTVGPYQVGAKYPVTEVLGWWLAEHKTEAPPMWLPVAGPLHHDREFFHLTALHYHVDPRFLSPELEQVVRRRIGNRNLHRESRDPASGYRVWHPAFTDIVVRFAWTDDDGTLRVLSIDHEGGSVARSRWNNATVRRENREWGAARIRRRESELTCTAKMPEAPWQAGNLPVAMQRIKRHYASACGDICPHRGYDLRSIPVRPDGKRQCPLHQLMVDTPTAPPRSQ